MCPIAYEEPVESCVVRLDTAAEPACLALNQCQQPASIMLVIVDFTTRRVEVRNQHLAAGAADAEHFA